MIRVEVYSTKNKKIGEISVDEKVKVKDIKEKIAAISPKLVVGRQSVRSALKGKDIKDDEAIPLLASTRKVFVKDLGPQIGWSTVFICEYAGPLILYALVALRPRILYSSALNETSLSVTARFGAAATSEGACSTKTAIANRGAASSGPGVLARAPGAADGACFNTPVLRYSRVGNIDIDPCIEHKPGKASNAPNAAPRRRVSAIRGAPVIAGWGVGLKAGSCLTIKHRQISRAANTNDLSGSKCPSRPPSPMASRSWKSLVSPFSETESSIIQRESPLLN
ncbi:hypothetical protein HUJ04_012379 [Dendroctonus ponderosae]|nr:hypothetical protein HUJ04_012379 [Dendroctonus ponderosae]